MGEKVQKFLSWWNDGVDFREFTALCIIGIFAYLVYFACKKMMMDTGLCELDIELIKIMSSQILVILCFYYGGNSAEKIIDSIFRNKKTKNKNESGDINNEL